MLKKIEKLRFWLMPVFLILFIAEILTLPLVLDITYAGRSDVPQHILTYKRNKLTWNHKKDIEKNGVAKLQFFETEYDNVTSENGDAVFAPGTEKNSIIRLKNAIENTVSYTAVVYEIKNNEQLPVKTKLKDSSFTDAREYILPDGVKDEQVVRAVTGKIKGGEIQDFDIFWVWEYFEDENQDIEDTVLGDSNEDVTLGFYLVIEDNNKVISPSVPKTGDNTILGGYAALMGISVVMMFLMLCGRKRENQ